MQLYLIFLQINAQYPNLFTTIVFSVAPFMNGNEVAIRFFHFSQNWNPESIKSSFSKSEKDFNRINEGEYQQWIE